MTNPAAPWRVIIADDEPLARQTVRGLMAGRAGFDVVGECRTGVEVVAAVGGLRPDLLFLDIQMPDLDGMAALDALGPDRKPLVVLITAFDEFAVPAYQQEVLDYLVKPFSDERFDLAVERISRRLAERTALSARYRARFLATSGRRSVSIPAGDVEWIEARSYYARLHFAGQHRLIRRSLTQLATELDPAVFLRVHRSAIVNLARIQELRREADGSRSIVLTSGAVIPVSERRLATVLARLG